MHLFKTYQIVQLVIMVLLPISGGCSKCDSKGREPADVEPAAAAEQEIKKNILAEAPEMQFAANASLEGKVTYLGMDVSHEKIQPGEPFMLTHYWKVHEAVPGWKLFVHCHDSSGKRFVNLDHVPIGGRHPVENWKPGEIIRDVHTVTLPANWPDTTADIFVGLWQNNRRLKVSGPNDGKNRVIAGRLPVAESLLVKLRRRYGEKLYSEYDEETLIRAFFKDKRDGFFLDVGAAAWRDNSTTYYLEENLGWKGIGIDANPDYESGFRENRKATKFFSYFVSDKSDQYTGFYVLPSDKPLASGDKEHLLRFHHVRQVADEIEKRKVRTITLNDLLEREGVEKVDFLSMDIEGAELAALAGFDIKRYKPDLVCIEVNHAGANKILSYFEKAGYKRIEEYLPLDRHNWYFAPR